ncbi:MAG: trypsin-like serine protease [Bacteroidota bacterium]
MTRLSSLALLAALALWAACGTPSLTTDAADPMASLPDTLGAWQGERPTIDDPAALEAYRAQRTALFAEATEGMPGVEFIELDVERMTDVDLPGYTAPDDTTAGTYSDAESDLGPVALDLDLEKKADVRAIFGRDDRGIPEFAAPYSRIGRLITEGGTCTAALVGPRHILTAAHCYGRKADGSLTNAIFVPLYDQGGTPLDTYATVTSTYAEAVPPRTANSEDYAISILDKPLGNQLGYFGLRSIQDDWMVPIAGKAAPEFAAVGYSGDWYDGERMGADWGTQFYGRMGGDRTVVAHDGDTTPGASGGPVIGYFPKVGWQIVGIIVAGPTERYLPMSEVLQGRSANWLVDVERFAGVVSEMRQRYP